MASVPLPHPRLRRTLERLASHIEDPVAKLRFLREAIDRFESQPPLLKNAPLLSDLVLLCLACKSIVRFGPRSGPSLHGVGLLVLLYRLRHVALGLSLLGFSYVAYLGVPQGYRLLKQGADAVVGFTTPTPALPGQTDRSPDTLQRFPARQNDIPQEVWLVESEEDQELWSNGLRVLTGYQTETQERSYLVFLREPAGAVEHRATPVGIVYHTSENDIAPFESDFNREILRTTRGLLRWLHKRNLYNYFIDRFGQVYRLVIDSHTASHAGTSIWSDEDHYYLNLSDSFLGVCFETQWDPQAAGEELLTPAQIQAGVNLTDVLRKQYDISDRNCVPHGLVSVNSKKMLIGYHVDWATGFPFASLGLTDKYEVPLPSLVEFGFAYDDGLVRILGGHLWPGIRRAQIELGKRAEAEGVQPEELRRRLRRQYRQNLELLKLAGVGGPSPAVISTDSGSP